MARKSNTRGAQGDGTIRKRKDGRWEARYTVGKDPGTGKQVQKSVYGKTQDEVRKKLKALTVAVDKGIFTEPSKMTVGQWLDMWINEYNSGVKQSTIDQYKYQIRVHLNPCLGAVKLTELTAPMVQKLYNNRQKPFTIVQIDEKGQKKKLQRSGLSPKSIKNLAGVLHEALDKALALGYIPVNVCNVVSLPKIQKVEMHPVTGENVPVMLKAFEENPYGDIFFITMLTGLREGEVLGLTWDCIDMKTGMISVYRQLQKPRGKGAKYQFAPLKNDKSRSFKVAPDVLETFRRVKRKQAENKLMVGSMWGNRDDFVFTNELGKHLSRDVLYNNLKKCADKAGIPETRFHDLRHTYATLALQQGVDIKTVSSNLGHATVAFTLDVYGHVSEQMQRDSADKMQGFLDSLNDAVQKAENG